MSVKLSELGFNCWLPKRFIKGSRCNWVYHCKYPEKQTCMAVDTEIEYLLQEKERVDESIDSKVDQLLKEREK